MATNDPSMNTGANPGIAPPLNPGDEAQPGTPGAAEDICDQCSGSGKLAGGADCPACGGTGRVMRGIGGG